MMLIRWIALGLGITLAMGAPALAADRYQLSRHEKGLVFDGVISAAAVTDLSAALHQHDKLLINSGAGDPDAALSLGNIVVDRDVSISVNGECLDACALYVFLPAHSKSAELAHSVRFGGSPFLIGEAIKRRKNLFSSTEQARFSKFLKDYRALLKRAKVPLRVLSCVSAAMEPDFRETRRGSPVRSRVFTNDVVVPTAFSRVTFSKDALRHLGIEVSGEYIWDSDPGFRASVVAENRGPLAWVNHPKECSGRTINDER